MGERPLRIDRIGLAGSSAVRFRATIRHGKGTRQIDVDVHAREILAISDAIRATANQACVDPRSRTGYPQDDLSVGHAIWHLDNPDRPMPCVTGRVIEVADDARLLGPSTEVVDAERLPGPPAEVVEAPGRTPDAQESSNEPSVEELLLPVRATSVLADAGVHSIRQLCQMTGGQLRGLPGSSDLVVFAVRRALNQVGAQMRGDGQNTVHRATFLAGAASTVLISSALGLLRRAFVERSIDGLATLWRERFDSTIGDAVRAGLLAYGQDSDLVDDHRRTLEAHCREWERMTGIASLDRELAVAVAVLLATVEQASHARRHPNSRPRDA